jgi:predicted DNA-binding mobile mystery protein A
MRNNNKLIIEQLGKKLEVFQPAESVLVPDAGWINALRTALNMTMSQLGDKLGVTRQGVKKIEESEARGAISLNSLREAGKGLGFKLVYGFVPEAGSIDNLINEKADALARKIVLRTSHNMNLENQAVSEERIEYSIRELSAEIKREMRKSLWD